MNERQCRSCGREIPVTYEGEQCLHCGHTLGADELQAPLSSDKRRCSHCGEELYRTESRCWRCGTEETPEPLVPPAKTQSAPSPPPPPPAPDVPAAPPPAVPAVAAPTPPPPSAPVQPAADETGGHVHGYWALVLAVLSLTGCLSLAAPFAIWQGVVARRKGAEGLGLAGIIIGILGCVMLLFFTAAITVGIIEAIMEEME